jgi:uncharacterized membrane protein YedE/YeeE
MLEILLERQGDAAILFMAGLGVGVLFGVAARYSRFCLRAATIELGGGRIGPRMIVWLIAFTMAVAATQGAIALGLADLSSARQLAATGSLSGAVIGGVLFGAGMILARGCVSRLLVLSAGGNLRAIVTGLVVTIAAQASLRGALSPAREWLAGLWLVPGGAGRDLGSMFGIGPGAAASLSLLALVVAMVLGLRMRAERTGRILASAGVGLAVALGWLATASIAARSFDIVPITSVTFTGPSSDTLMALINDRSLPLTFATGLVPGVVLGAFATALISGEFRIERFGAETPLERYLVGAVLMGFGSMLAGGCAVGAAVSGGALLSLTAWVAGASMWAGAIAAQILLRGLAARGLAAGAI